MKPVHAMLLCGLALPACAGDAPHARIMKVALDTIPFVDIADADAQSEPVFELPTGAARFANGNIAVGDYYGGKVAFFDSTGRFIRSVGRRGSGPGEYEIVMWQGACASDSIFVVEPVKRRVDVLAANGTIARSYPDVATGGFVDCRRNGTRLAWFAEPMHRMPRHDDPPSIGELRVVDAAWEKQRSLGKFEWGLYGPMRPVNHIALGHDEIYIANGTSGIVDAWSLGGTKLRSFDTGARQRPAADRHFEAALSRWVWYLTIRDEREEMKQMMRRLFPKPDRLPAITDLAVDTEGIVWAVTSYPGDGTTSLHAYTSTGSPAGSATLPVELTIFDIGADYLLGSFEDDEGFPHVALYRVRRPTGS